MSKRIGLSAVILLAFGAFLLVRSGMAATTDGAPETPEEGTRVITRMEAISQLPCFKCHRSVDFFKADTEGRYSHVYHMELGLHCNQCHVIRGHESPVIRSSTCAACHDLEIKFKGGGLGKVTFSHEFHTSAFPCKECHTSSFHMKAGMDKISMDECNRGHYCGQCHNGKVAFSVKGDCMRCHKS